MEQEVYNYDSSLKESTKYFNGDKLAAKVFLDKYALRDNKQNLLEDTPDKMHVRIATELARIEKKKFKNPMSFEEILSYIQNFKKIVPQGSLMSGIGNPYQYVTLSNCFVTDPPLDSYSGILHTDQQMVQICKRRGGVGTDISNLRPDGTPTTNAARTSTGIISFMERFSNSIREVGQCLFKDTLILTKHGLKKIKNINKGDQVWTNQKWVNVTKKIKNSKHCVKITTKYGKEIICSNDHVFHTINGQKKASQLKDNDPITQIVGGGWKGTTIDLGCKEYEKVGLNKSNHLKNHPLPSILDKNLAYFIGYSYGDGYVERHYKDKSQCGLSLACSNDWTTISKKLCDIFESIFNFKMKIKKGDGDYTIYRFSSKLIIDFLKKNKLLKQKAGKLIFPNKILQAKKEIVFAFLSGLFDADGCAIKGKKAYKFTSIDRDFILAIQSILSSFGIVSNSHKTIRPNNWRTIYNLHINGPKSQKIFRELMGYSEKVKLTKIGNKRNDWTRSVYKMKDFGSKASRHSYVSSNNQYLSYNACNTVCKDLDLTKEIYLLQDFVKSIEKYKNEKQDVYDLCLEKEHLFFANGLYAHNSGRRGALLLTISVHHPEILKFTKVKRDLTKVTGANISIRLTNEFLEAVEKNKEYEMRWPVDSKNPKISRMVNAKDVWRQIVENAHAMAEPGILFWDKIISESPADCYSKYGFTTVSCNPCSELTLSKLDSCRLLLLNLFGYVIDPFTKNAKFDFEQFYKDSQVAQRFMDNVIDLELECVLRIIEKIKNDPEPDEIKSVELSLWKEIYRVCETGRRTGTGLTGLGDTLAALGLKYDSNKGIKATERIYRTLKLGCYRSSVEMAKELGPFKVWEHDLEKKNPFLLRIKEEDPELYKDMKKYGRRNIGLLTSAPAGCLEENAKIRTNRGTISLKNLFEFNGINIDDLKNQKDLWFDCDEDIYVYDVHGNEQKINKLYWNGFCEGYDFEFSSGEKLKTSKNHKLLVLIDENTAEWRNADELKINDKIIKLIKE